MNILLKIIQWLRELFRVNIFDCGTLNVDWTQNDEIIFVSVTPNVDVVSVWINMTVINNPYDEIGMQTFDYKLCYVSEVISVPGGFQFKVNLIPGSSAVIGWFAVERSV